MIQNHSSHPLNHHLSQITLLFRELVRQFEKKEYSLSRTKIFRKKQILYLEGSPTIGLYCLRSGKAKIYKTGTEGRPQILRLAEPGHMVGLESILMGDLYTTTAEMVEEGSVSFIEKTIFFDFLKIRPDMALKVMRLLSLELEVSESERIELAQNTVRERMARLLNLLSQNYGSPCEEGIRINLSLSREELAEMAGTVAETAMRLLKDFREEKVLAIQGREIIVTNQRRLEEVAHLEENTVRNHLKT